MDPLLLSYPFYHEVNGVGNLYFKPFAGQVDKYLPFQPECWHGPEPGGERFSCHGNARSYHYNGKINSRHFTVNSFVAGNDSHFCRRRLLKSCRINKPIAKEKGRHTLAFAGLLRQLLAKEGSERSTQYVNLKEKGKRAKLYTSSQKTDGRKRKPSLPLSVLSGQ